MATIADVRIHSTTHERPIDRFAQERAALVATTGQPSFRLEAPLARVVAARARPGTAIPPHRRRAPPSRRRPWKAPSPTALLAPLASSP